LATFPQSLIPLPNFILSPSYPFPLLPHAKNSLPLLFCSIILVFATLSIVANEMILYIVDCSLLFHESINLSLPFSFIPFQFQTFHRFSFVIVFCLIDNTFNIDVSHLSAVINFIVASPLKKHQLYE
jgi:hypothetical protein